ncbi:MAG: XrtA system polysaccharide deacetylase [Pseudomonadota bacterium]
MASTGQSQGSALVHGMSVDVEDYYQVWALSSVIKREDWDAIAPRVELSTRRSMDLFAEAGVTATFFTLGCVAERHPQLIRDIVAAGHELGSHGYAHYKVFEQTDDEFRADVERTKKTLEDISGAPVNGYRAAGFSINRDNWGAFDILAEAGHLYSSSLHPIAHDHYGAPDAPRFAFHPIEGSDFTEVPVATVDMLGRRVTCAGGGFFRLLPYMWTKRCLKKLEREDATPSAFYFHPWEVDPDQPKTPGLSLKSRVRHYTNLDVMADKLAQLLKDFRWTRMDEAHGLCGRDAAA